MLWKNPNKTKWISMIHMAYVFNVSNLGISLIEQQTVISLHL